MHLRGIQRRVVLQLLEWGTWLVPGLRKAKREIARLSIELATWKKECYDLTHENVQFKIQAQEARAQLCQLRVDPGSYAHRLGYMIGTFVPEEVVKKLQANPERASEFKHAVVDTMMESMLRGFLFRKPENQRCVAMVFLPRGEKFTRSTVLPVFEYDGKYEINVPDKLREEINREIELQKQREQKLLGY